MTQINAVVSFKGRLPRIVGQAALAVSVLAGGFSLLCAGGALAATDTFQPTPFIPPILQDGTTIQGYTGPTPIASGGDVEFVTLTPEVFTVDTDFGPDLQGPVAGAFHYSLTNDNGWYKGALTANIVPGFPGTSVTKSLCTDNTFSVCTDLYTIVNSGASNGGSLVDLPALFYGDQTIYVKDSYSALNSGARLDNFANTFQTPGPLPILGAGAAFGFSRKLRHRIKAARAA